VEEKLKATQDIRLSTLQIFEEKNQNPKNPTAIFNHIPEPEQIRKF
jgi:hypothetical protein